MGIEDSALSADEAAKLPISGPYPPTHLPKQSNHKQHLDEAIPSGPLSKEWRILTTANFLDTGGDPRTRAYVFTVEQVSRLLGVDPQYVVSRND
jgi:hypothetical protein